MRRYKETKGFNWSREIVIKKKKEDKRKELLSYEKKEKI